MDSITEFHEYVLNDLFGEFRGITSKRMFGGYGYYLDGDIFAIVTSDSELYFKVGEANKEQYESLGSEPFVYTGHKSRGPTEMPYWLLPEEIKEDKEKLWEWIQSSAAITRNQKK